MPLRLPLFPLNLVLFPGTPLPLHIFEPRYRQMLADCLAADERFGILIPGADGQPPAAGAIGCVAHIRATQALADGRSNIVVVGESRFELLGIADERHPYLVGMVEPFRDDPAEAAEAELVSELKEVFGRYFGAIRVLSDAEGPDLEWDESAEAFSLQVAAAVESELEFKERMLALRSTRVRVRLLLALLRPMADDAMSRAVVHLRARSNGKGGHHPEILTEE